MNIIKEKCNNKDFKYISNLKISIQRANSNELTH